MKKIKIIGTDVVDISSASPDDTADFQGITRIPVMLVPQHYLLHKKDCCDVCLGCIGARIKDSSRMNPLCNIMPDCDPASNWTKTNLVWVEEEAVLVVDDKQQLKESK